MLTSSIQSLGKAVATRTFIRQSNSFFRTKNTAYTKKNSFYHKSADRIRVKNMTYKGSVFYCRFHRQKTVDCT